MYTMGVARSFLLWAPAYTTLTHHHLQCGQGCNMVVTTM